MAAHLLLLRLERDQHGVVLAEVELLLKFSAAANLHGANHQGRAAVFRFHWRLESDLFRPCVAFRRSTPGEISIEDSERVGAGHRAKVRRLAEIHH